MKKIKDFPNYSITKDGQIWSTGRPGTKGGCLIPSSSRNYFKVALWNNGKPISRLIHHLVLETFVGPCPPGMECRHLNGNPKDNRLENLKWGTRSENQRDSIKHGTAKCLHQCGELSSVSKLTEQDVRMIIYMYKTGEFIQQEIADIYNVTRTQVSRIVNKKLWKHIWRN